MLCFPQLMQPRSQYERAIPNITSTCSPASPLVHGQALRTKAHGQQLLQSKHRRLSILVVHQNRHRRLKCHHQVSFNSASRSSPPQHLVNPTSRLTSQNSRIYCLHMPQGLAGGEISVATARARISPRLAPSTTAVPRAVRSAQVPTG
jgi:hypothetical protein